MPPSRRAARSCADQELMHRRSRKSTARALALAGVAAVLAGCGGGHASSHAKTTTTGGVQNRGFGTYGGRLGTQGSLGGVPVPFPPSVFHLTNMWLAKRNGVYVDVYAGSSPQTPKEGALVVIWTDPKVGSPEPKSGTFKTGRATGPLTMTRVDGNTVYFRFKGDTGTFDLGTLKYSFG
jgi:hypothetical protein